MLRNLFIGSRFFLAFGAVIIAFVLGYIWPFMFPVAQVMLLGAVAVVIADVILISILARSVRGERQVPDFYSLGEENKVTIILENVGRVPMRLSVLDEVPLQLQLRELRFTIAMKPGEKKETTYLVRPLSRGLYHFGIVNVLVSSPLGFVHRRVKLGLPTAVKVYPSVMQMKRFELRTLNRIARYEGVKKMRKIGHSYEFEQIKTYVAGDDNRSVNWKATGRRGGELMVNQYEDERAQQVYTIIDKSRSMKLPFNGLSLMDHAINTALVISNVALQKTDRPGLITFADKIDTIVHAQSNASQMPRILEALYSQRESDLEANFELLYRSVRRHVKGRSLLILMTNFETLHNMQRAKALLRRISRLHLLVVVFFENIEIADFSKQPSEDIDAIYHQTIARKFIAEKRRMITELENFGIKSVFTRPEELTVQVINAYLELKARGMI